MDNISNISNLYNSNMINQNAAKVQSSKLTNKVSNLSQNSTEEELTEAVKSFESYFVEQVMKEMEKSAKMWNDDDKNDSTSQLVDLNMDSVYQDMASKFVDKVGGRFTESLVKHMKLTYGIKDSDNGTESD